jgi:hypothetical protein
VLINSSRAESRVNSLKSNVSGTVSVPIITAIIALMMGTETVPETLDFNELTWLSAQEEFINFSRRESFTSYIKVWFIILNTDQK